MSLKSMNKAQLAACIEQQQAQLLEQAREIASLREQLAMNRPVGYTDPRPQRRGPPPHFNAARAMAIATGRTVKIEV